MFCCNLVLLMWAFFLDTGALFCELCIYTTWQGQGITKSLLYYIFYLLYCIFYFYCQEYISGTNEHNGTIYSYNPMHVINCKILLWEWEYRLNDKHICKKASPSVINTATHSIIMLWKYRSPKTRKILLGPNRVSEHQRGKCRKGAFQNPGR